MECCIQISGMLPSYDAAMRRLQPTHVGGEVIIFDEKRRGATECDHLRILQPSGARV